jgi:hypothetical protein
MDFEGTDSNQRGEVTLRAFYYFNFPLLIERVLWLLCILFNFCDIQIVDYWMVSIFCGCITLWLQSANVMLIQLWHCECVLFQDDTVFEKQSTLFALAIADVVLINMWVLCVHHYNIRMPFLPGKFDKWPQLGMTLPSQKKNSWCSLPKSVRQSSTFFCQMILCWVSYAGGTKTLVWKMQPADPF